MNMYCNIITYGDDRKKKKKLELEIKKKKN